MRTYCIGIYQVLFTDKTAYVHMQCCNSLMMLVFFEISLEVRPQIHKHKYASRQAQETGIKNSSISSVCIYLVVLVFTISYVVVIVFHYYLLIVRKIQWSTINHMRQLFFSSFFCMIKISSVPLYKCSFSSTLLLHFAYQYLTIRQNIVVAKSGKCTFLD